MCVCVCVCVYIYIYIYIYTYVYIDVNYCEFVLNGTVNFFKHRAYLDAVPGLSAHCCLTHSTNFPCVQMLCKITLVKTFQI